SGDGMARAFLSAGGTPRTAVISPARGRLAGACGGGAAAVAPGQRAGGLPATITGWGNPNPGGIPAGSPAPCTKIGEPPIGVEPHHTPPHRAVASPRPGRYASTFPAPRLHSAALP